MINTHGMVWLCLGILIVISLTVASAVPQSMATPKTLSELVKDSVDAVVLLVVADKSGKPIAEGSGFIISADGRIVTNHHVIANAGSVLVKLNNGAAFNADGIIADDPTRDLAIIKVSGKSLPSLTLGDSDHISAGDHVVAIGSPLGLENSVSDGIVSAIREGEKSGGKLIQITVPASHGNSGGPLISMDGKVIGIVTLKATEGENLNFAIPSNVVAGLSVNTAAVKPFGTSFASNESLSSIGTTNVWTSMTTGRDYKLRQDGNYLYVEWTNIPTVLQSTAAFVRSELKKDGTSWSGTTRMYLPCEYKSSYSEFWTTGQRRGTPNIKWCSIESAMRIDKLSENRIEGISQAATEFDCRKCLPKKLEWKPFTWIPK